MSRIGNKIVEVPSNVTFTQKDGKCFTKGPKGELELTIPPLVKVEEVEGGVQVSIDTKIDKRGSAMQGLTRSLIYNMVTGVTEGFSKDLLIIGVGYRAQVSGKNLVLNIGYSHKVEYAIPEGITITVADNTKLKIEGADKQAVGQAAATIRKFRKPEPYKGKGIRYADEQITLKEGKSVG
jgi:large subunit ribosomal protein L6